ncbi:MAG: hypothetical protein NVSMB1_17570 [Polyangiales bacterium]
MPVPERGTIYATARDITPQRDAERVLRELSESLSTTLASIGEGVIATDVHGCVLRMNPMAEKLTGFAFAECQGKPLSNVFRLLDPKTRAAAPSPVDRALREKSTVGQLHHRLLIKRDGHEVPIADNCAPIRDANENISGAVLVFRDVSEQQLAARTQALAEKQLVMADRLSSVGTLAAGVAHEINNPLSYVTANLDLVIEEVRALGGGSPSRRMKDLEEMALQAREGAERVRKIVRGLKTFSRMEEERRVPTDIIPVLELSINMTFNEIRHRGRLVKNYGSIPPVDADEARLGQVFINLMMNAAQALKEGDNLHNEIHLVTRTAPDGQAIIEVSDNGPGIPDELLGKIFDPFFTTKPVGIGTGLGLSICHNIVDAMGGTISAQSTLGAGSTFRVTLPAAAAAIGGPIREAQRRPSSLKPSRRATILVVDDEPTVGITVRRVLRDHDVTLVTTGAQALKLIDMGRQFDVILCDLMMPEMTGVELYEHLEAAHPALVDRVVFITGGAFTPAANLFLDRVPNERLEKPFDMQNLRAVVQRFARISQMPESDALARSS